MTRRSIARLALVAALAGAAVVCWIGFRDYLNADTIEAAVRNAGAFAPIMFVAVFALATIVFLPGALFGLAGGVLFGPLWGTVWNLVGATLGATIAFLIARFIAGDWIAAKAKGRLQTLLSGVDAQGWRFVALTRLVPIVPFNLLNYALGLTRIPILQYVIATVVCMVPGTAAYAWLGHAGKAALSGDTAALSYAAFGLAALALILFLPRLIQRLRSRTVFISVQDLKVRLAAGARLNIIDVRNPDEFAVAHIPDALNIPLPTVSGRANEIRGGSAVVVVCKTEKRSALAAATLRELGIPAIVLKGGMDGWAQPDAREPGGSPIGA